MIFQNTALIQSARQAISQNYRYVLLRVISIMEGDCHAYAKKQDDLQLIANHPAFQFETCFFSASSSIPITHQAIFSVKLHFYFNFKNIFLYIILMNILFKNQ